MTFFLKLRHWELFLMLALPTVLCFLFRVPFGILVISAIGLFLMIVLFAWMFSIAAWSNANLPPDKRRNLLPFGAGLVLPIVYILMYILLVIPAMESATPPDRPPLWLLPMHMFSLAGIFYGIWFTARQFKTLQEAHKQDFLIFGNMFFLLFIFPLGVWIIQPSVNQMFFKLDPANRYLDDN